MSSRMLLPIELVLYIIDSSVPHASDAILDASHPTTKLLLAFTLVCHETRCHAVRYLRQHCVNLDSDPRPGSCLGASSTQLALHHITSLSLTPFEDSIENSFVCDLIRELLCHVCDTLKKLVVDIPLRFHRQDRQGVRPVLREAFECLVNLKEFVSIQDNADIESVRGGESSQIGRVCVWESWPKLKRLCLGHGDYVDKTFWDRVALCPSFETLFVCSISALSRCDPKFEYLKHTTRPFRLVILDTPSCPSNYPPIAGIVTGRPWTRRTLWPFLTI